jgi:hypothetical protein
VLKAALDRSAEAKLRETAARSIRVWIAAALGDDAYDRLVVVEAPCADPDCPPAETWIELLGGAAGDRRLRIPRPMKYVGADDVAAAVRAYRAGANVAPVDSCC